MTNIMFSTEPLEFDKYFFSNFSHLSDGKYTVLQGKENKIRKGHYEIYETSELDLWNDCRFHFEIRWSDDLALRETKEVRVVAHIESVCNSKMPQVTEQIRTMYSKKSGDNIIIKKTVIMDFSSEETTLKSIKCIVNVLESDDFRSIAANVKELI